MESAPMYQHQVTEQPQFLPRPPTHGVPISQTNQTPITYYQPIKGDFQSERNIAYNNINSPTNRFTMQTTTFKPNEFQSGVHPLSPRGSKVNFNYGGSSVRSRPF